jgi:Coenzyme PQQ synthesis protein D (PqqD)
MTDLLRLRDDKLEWREIDEEIVALDGRTSEYLSVNRSGAALWPLLLAGATRGVLVERLTEAFDVDRATAERDLDAFLEVLSARDLLER